ncbi:MAG: 16S rRNA (guanine(966)-N(2))-methyltransferase RsmD [Pseudomonadota bacterium]|nr:16S rRNA (guanine(966)-N(2))-methyltransferase RsmD [Pseudomonadota bacterium]
MRIVAGRFRGARLAAPKGHDTRPTGDKVRQAVFNILRHGIEDFEIEGARVLDAFAGTGALGLEALSQGARYCLFIDNDASARAAIRQNVEALSLTGDSRIWRRDVASPGPAGTLEPFNLVFLDPPYGKRLGTRALLALHEGGWIAAGGVCVLEERADADVSVPKGFNEIDRRRYGDTQVIFLKAPQN